MDISYEEAMRRIDEYEKMIRDTYIAKRKLSHGWLKCSKANIN